GELVLDPEVVQGLLGRRRNVELIAQLTGRERDVLQHMAEGRSNQRIAAEMTLAAKTVESHVAAVFTKLGLPPSADDNRRVLAVLYCVAAQWPLWVPPTYGLAAVNLLVTVSFFATGVFVSAEPGHRVTGTVLIIAALLWPLNWVNEWMAGPWPLVAALEGPLA